MRVPSDSCSEPDFQDVFSVLLATYLRYRPNAFGSVLWDVFNPAVPVPKTEVYARCLTLEQPGNSIVRTDGGSLAELASLCDYVRGFELLFPYFFTWERRNQQDYSFRGEVMLWAQHVSQATGEAVSGRQISDDRNVQYNQRWSPDWLYYRSIRRRVTILESARTVAALQSVLTDKEPQKELQGINRHLYVSTRVRSAVPLLAERLGLGILRRLNRSDPPQVTVVPLENRLLCAGGTYLVVLSRYCGLRAFREEARRIEWRHRKEAALLFPSSGFLWSSKIDDERFELLVRELLAHEPGVIRVRKVGRSRDRDRGKDLIAEWLTPLPAESLIPDGAAPNILRKVLVQVKASSKSVNKNAVKDIRDTLDDHKAGGYFLAVSSQITSDLTDHLDRIRGEGKYWTHWWNRIEIEERLNTYPEIALRYRDLVTRSD